MFSIIRAIFRMSSGNLVTPSEKSMQKNYNSLDIQYLLSKVTYFIICNYKQLAECLYK